MAVLKYWDGAAWQVLSGGGGGLTLPLTQPLTFSPDNTHAIGAAADSRPSTIYAGTAFVGPSATLSGNLTFSGTSRRILGDFSNATESNRLLFQTSTANGVTLLGVIPNGTASGAYYTAFTNAADPGNAGYMYFGMDSSTAAIGSSRTGSGAYVPLRFDVGGAERLRIATDGVITASGNLTFSDTGRRILGDFTNGTPASRVLVQSSTTNGLTLLSVAPNGSATLSGYRSYGNSNLTNAPFVDLWHDGSKGQITVGHEGAGVDTPFVFNVSGLERMRIAADGVTSFSGTVTLNGNSLCGTGTQAMIRYTGNGGGETLIQCSGPGGMRIVNAANTVQLASVNTAGDFWCAGSSSANGRVQGNDLFATGGYVYAGGAGTPGSPHIIGSGNMLYYRAVQHNFQDTSGANNNIYCNIIGANGRVDTPQLYFPNGYYLTYVSGQAMLYTNGAFNAGSFTVGTLAPTGWAIWLPNNADSMSRGVANQWAIHSAARYKTNVRPIADPLAIVSHPKLHGHRYDNLNDLQGRQSSTPSTSPSLGFIADDWLTVLPEVVSLDDAGQPVALDYDRIGAVTFEAVKHLSQQVQDLQARVAQLEA